MRIRDYEIPKATLALLVLLAVVAVGAGLYLLRGDSEIPEATETAPSATTPGATTMSGTPPPTAPAETTPAEPAPRETAPTQTTPRAPATPPAFQPTTLPGPPPERLVADARRLFPSFTRTESPPKGGYWLGPSINGLDAYLQPKALDPSGQPLVVYTTPERFVRAEGVYVRTLLPGSPLGREMVRSLDRYGRESRLGPYVVIAPGSIAVRVDDQIVNVVVVGAIVRDFDAAELVAALKR